MKETESWYVLRDMIRIGFLAVLVAVFLLPSVADASYREEVAGWIPWWAEEKGIESAEDNLRDLDTIYPFIYEVNDEGDIISRADLDDRDWKNLFKKARRKDVEIIPTIAWFDGPAIHEMLSSRKNRKAHIEEIVDLVQDENFDGIDIDYEAKLAKTIDYFSDFLEELEDELGRDILTCTIEARTPPESLYRNVPKNIQYANDYKAINRHCDRIELMAYDQQRADLKLNSEKAGEPYMPVADTDWVEKVVEFALEDFRESRVILGVPTYGREWELTVSPNWYEGYKRVTAMNMPEALELAEEYDKKPGRNKAGELSFSYFPDDSPFKVLEALPTPEGTTKGNEAAAKALWFADLSGMTVKVNYVTISDAESIEDKLDLIKKYDLRGVSLFKIDGEEDQDIWDLF
ncbi:MAG: spore germination protein [Candidatus Azotimanducaceae bacterium]|jgi:spore germination protein